AALSPDDLAPIRAGFRHRYIIDAAQKVADGTINLESLRSLPYEEARQSLMQITGVGVKVADCVLLYGLHRLDGFPLDVWMKRAMATLFPGVSPSDFGCYAGIAQQYIFHYSRMHPELFGE
ncbi:MAG: DNA-3-methyladenine glycosylase 2 family protein, partial [Ruminococcus sp.]|nr:DNA-3-methyladenine glycosylase 2 family protein [Ruminococcus sp.]